MSHPTLHTLLHTFQQAKRPEDVFDDLAGTGLDGLKQRYRQLVMQVHPDHNKDNSAIADEAFKLLQQWYELAQIKLTQGSYGFDTYIRINSAHRYYEGSQPPLRGDLCDVYPALADTQPVMLKVVRKPQNNDLLQAEATALRRIHRHMKGDPLRAHFPTLLESFKIADANNVERMCNVLNQERNYVSVADVIAAYPSGVDSADMAWMFNRTLAALAKTHEAGLVHGAVLPPHMLLRLADHNGMLIDWCYAIEQEDTVKAIAPAYKPFYPPEVLAKQPATPATDLYLAAMTITALLGGDVATKQLPPSVPKPIAALLRGCLLPSPHRRNNDAWELHEQFGEILQRLYGPPTFREFRMPR